MTVRTYGPTRGAGVRVEEQSGQKTLTPGALGFVGYAGLCEKGPVNELHVVTSKTEFAKKYGGIIDAGTLPDCAYDYYDVANGAGGIAMCRVTDGNEVAASIKLYTRNGALRTLLGTLTAANGGRWGGKDFHLTADLDADTDLTETTLQLPAAISSNYKLDQFKGGWIELDAVPNARYEITGNDATGLITVKSDQTMKTEWTAAAAPTNLRFYVYLENGNKALSVSIGDGDDDPANEFSLSVFVDGDLFKRYPSLSTDPTNAKYWVNIINNDDYNDQVVAAQSYAATYDATSRPSDYSGLIDTVTTTVLTAVLFDATINSPTGADPTTTLGTTTDDMIEQTITVTMGAAGAFASVVSDVLGDLVGSGGPGATGAEFTPDNKWAPPFTITDGATVLASGDTVVIQYKPFKASELVGGYVYPDKVNAPYTRFTITANDHASVTVGAGNDLTADGAAADTFMIIKPREFSGGVDGNNVVDADYVNGPWDAATSPFNNLVGMNLGLVKFATPGVNSTTVAKAGRDYAAAKNHQYRHEIPAATVTEESALAYMNDTIGRNDYQVVSFPSYGDVPDPDAAAARAGKRKTIPLTGMIHGREARIAADYLGYHKAEAGTEATLPRLLALPTGTKVLNEELLNPAGIGVIKKAHGNFVLWGDRVPFLDSNWRWKHQREQMSYYEHVLQENFDFIVFSINDATSDKVAYTAMVNYFLPEYTKRAIRGDKFLGNDKNAALILKIDSELNTDATRAAGDKIASVNLKLADTTERFIIRIGKQGIFEQVA